MGRITYDFHSNVQQHAASLTVLIPDSRQRPDPGYPVLYLLHGLSGDDEQWSRYTELERLANHRELLVVMPDVGQSWYCDEALGIPYWTFLTQEVPAIAQGVFGATTARQDTFVAGLSMGGYGAIKWALNYPGEFGAAASLAGALLRHHTFADYSDPGSFEWKASRRIWGGESSVGTQDDLLNLLRQADPASLPRLLVSCGTEDFLIEENRTFRLAAEERGIQLAGGESVGAHDFDYWTRELPGTLEWMLTP